LPGGGYRAGMTPHPTPWTSEPAHYASLGETPIDDQMASRRGRSCRAKSACEPEDPSRS
jgi:hypothetical protein